jgi:hypothetical protein
MSTLLPLSWLLSTGLFGFSFVKVSFLGLVFFFVQLIHKLKINRNLLIGSILLLIPCIIEVFRFGTVENFLLMSRVMGCFGLFILSKSNKYKILNITAVWWVVTLFILMNIYQHPPVANGKLIIQGFLGQQSPINPPQGFVGMFAALSFYIAGLKGKKIWCLFFIVILILSNSRAAILAVIVSLPLLVPFFYNRRNLYLILLTCVALSMFYIFLNYQLELAFITSGRSVIYSTFLNSIQKNWAFGVGAVDNIPSVAILFENALSRDFDDGRGNSYTFGANGFVAPHNDYLLLLFRGGILAVIGAYFLTKKYLFDSFSRPEQSKWLYVLFVFWFVFIFFENAITWPPLYIYLGLLKREGSLIVNKI